MSKISVVGAGHVGLVTATCFAELGHQVTIIEIDKEKLHLLELGTMPMYEEGLPQLWRRHWNAGMLRLTNSFRQGLQNSEFAFVCVGTPSKRNGEPDLKYVRSAARSIAEAASGYITVVNKSTVPIGTGELMTTIMKRYKNRLASFAVVSNPEFLREGLAVFDFLHPSRVIVGSSDAQAAQAVARLYEPLCCPIILCDTATAEMSKYACNTFLATKISFINEIASLCDSYGVDVNTVASIMGMDNRIGSAYLKAGLGWGGSCLPKDVRALIHIAKSRGLSFPLLRSVLSVNTGRPKVIMTKLRSRLGDLKGKTIGVLGVAFKPNSDDIREAPSLGLISLLKEEGCYVKVYDPAAMEAAVRVLPEVIYCTTAYDVAVDSDALVLVTEWEEFRKLDMKRVSSLMKFPYLIDGRNIFNPTEMTKAGLIYEGIGHNNSIERRKQAEIACEHSGLEPQVVTEDASCIHG